MSRRRRVFERDDWQCQCCGKVGTEQTLRADHVRPLSQGGADDVANMQTLCVACHDAKSAVERGHESA